MILGLTQLPTEGCSSRASGTATNNDRPVHRLTIESILFHPVPPPQVEWSRDRENDSRAILLLHHFGDCRNGARVMAQKSHCGDKSGNLMRVQATISHQLERTKHFRRGARTNECPLMVTRSGKTLRYQLEVPPRRSEFMRSSPTEKPLIRRGRRGSGNETSLSLAPGC